MKNVSLAAPSPRKGLDPSPAHRGEGQGEGGLDRRKDRPPSNSTPRPAAHRCSRIEAARLPALSSARRPLGVMTAHLRPTPPRAHRRRSSMTSRVLEAVEVRDVPARHRMLHARELDAHRGCGGGDLRQSKRLPRSSAFVASLRARVTRTGRPSPRPSPAGRGRSSVRSSVQEALSRRKRAVPTTAGLARSPRLQKVPSPPGRGERGRVEEGTNAFTYQLSRAPTPP